MSIYLRIYLLNQVTFENYSFDSKLHHSLYILFIDLQNIKIKEELIELSSDELEAARITIQNLSFINHRLCFQFECNACQYTMIERGLFEEHLRDTHNGLLEWTGFCSSCDAYIIGHDANLLEEFNHMLKVHVKQTDVIVLDPETSKGIRPLLKLRCLDGDYLSAKNF